MYTRKNNGPKTEPCGTPADTVPQCGYFPCSTTSYWRLVKKLWTKAKSSPDTPIHLSLLESLYSESQEDCRKHARKLK